MAAYQRPQVAVLLEYLAEPVRNLIVVAGPRQTGKTYLVRQALSHFASSGVERPSLSGGAQPKPPPRGSDIQGPNWLFFAVDRPNSPRDLYRFEATTSSTATSVDSKRDGAWLVRCWEDGRDQAWKSSTGFVLVFDEIQKIPGWSDIVKGLWDQDRYQKCPMHVVILGSAPVLMDKGLSDSLAGRIETIRVTHWSLPEMQQAFGFDMERFVYFGGYPGAAIFTNNQPRWETYIRDSIIAPHIERDILAMVDVRKPALLKRTFELGCAMSGQIASYRKMLGQLDDAGNATTLAGYIDLLAKVGLLAGLQQYCSQLHRSKRSNPKLNVLNTALMSATSGYTFEQARGDRTFWGRLIESAVGAHLLNTRGANMEVYYWRGKSSLEVDFVLRLGTRTIAIEVKSASGRNDAGFEAFREQFAPEKCLHVGHNGVPLEEFLTCPATQWFRE